MRSSSFWMASSALLLAAVLPAQTSLNSLSAVVNVSAPEKVIAKRNQPVDVDLVVQVKQGYHVNSNAPADEFLIPLKLTFANATADVAYPKPANQKFAFSEKAMSVYEGDVKLRARVQVPANASPGLSQLNGKLRYQACNDRMCLPPRTLEVKIPFEIRN